MKLTDMQANLETYAQRIESLRAKVAPTPADMNRE
jgi:hypothetical protein